MFGISDDRKSEKEINHNKMPHKSFMYGRKSTQKVAVWEKVEIQFRFVSVLIIDFSHNIRGRGYFVCFVGFL